MRKQNISVTSGQIKLTLDYLESEGGVSISGKWVKPCSLKYGLSEVKGVVKGHAKVMDILDYRFWKEKNKVKKQVEGHEEEIFLSSLMLLGIYGQMGISSESVEGIPEYSPTFMSATYSAEGFISLILENGRPRIHDLDLSKWDEGFTKGMSVYRKCLQIMRYREMIEISKRENLGEIEILDSGEISDMEDPEFYKATHVWIEKSQQDVDWLRWGQSKIEPCRSSVLSLIEEEFQKEYNLSANEFSQICRFFEKLCNAYYNHQKIDFPIVTDLPTLIIKRRHLKEIFERNMGQESRRKWIRELEYKEWRDVRERPLIPFFFKGEAVYHIPVWVFYPHDECWAIRINPITAKNKIRDRLFKNLGRVFEEYLDEQTQNLKLSSVSIIDDVQARVFREKDHSEIKRWLNWLGKSNEFEVDLFIVVDNTCYIVSCKTWDLIRTIVGMKEKFYYFLSDIRREIQKNLKAMREVYIWKELFQSNPDLLRERGINAAELIPVLITTRDAPFSFIEVREYYKGKKWYPEEVLVLTVKKFIEKLKNDDIKRT